MGGLSFKKVMVVSAALVGATAWAGAGYLPAIGPSALKFQDAPMRLDPAVVLPPLKMSDQTSTNTVAVSQTNTNSFEDVELLSPMSGETVVSSQSHILPSDDLLSVPANRSESDLNPQLLLRYFNKSSNQETLISPHVQFTPPPPPLRGSSVTYSSE